MNVPTERKYHDQANQPGIELLAQGQAIYYVGGHTGHPLTHDRGRQDAHIWADYINVGMEHGSFDMAGLAEYMRGLVEGGRPRHQCGEFAREYLAWCDPWPLNPMGELLLASS